MSRILKLKQKYHKFYKSIGLVISTAINENVVFNNHGWKHFRYSGRGHRRPSTSIVMRLKLLPFIPQVVRKAKVIIKNNKRIVRIKGKLKVVEYFEIANEVIVLGRTKHITVILRRIESGTLHYLSCRYTSKKTKKALKGLL